MSFREQIRRQFEERNHRTNEFSEFVADYQSALGRCSRARRQNLAYEDKIRSLYHESNELKRRLEGLQSQKVGGISLSTISDLQAKIDQLEVEVAQSFKQRDEAAKHMLELTRALKEVRQTVLDREAALDEAKLGTNTLELEVNRLREDKAANEMTMRVMREELQALQYKLGESQDQLAKFRRQYDELVQRWIRLKTAEAEEHNRDLIEHSKRLKSQQVEERMARAASSMESTVEELTKKGLLGTSTRPVSAVPTTARRVFTAHRGEVNHLVYNATGAVVATCSNDRTVKIFDSSVGQCVATLKGSVQSVTRVDIAMNDLYVLGACNDHSTRVWSLGRSSSELLHTLTGHMQKVMGAKFTMDSKRVVTGSHDRNLKIWSLDRGFCTQTIFCYSSCNDLALNPESSLIISGHVDNTVRVWDFRSGESVQNISSAHTRPVTAVAASPDSRHFASVSRDNSIKIYDFRSMEPLANFKDIGFRVGANWTNITWSPDGQYVAAGSTEGHIWVWNAQTKKLAKKLTGPHQKMVVACAWNPGNNQIASGDRDGTCAYWE